MCINKEIINLMETIKMKKVDDRDVALTCCGGRKASYLVGLSSKNDKNSEECQDKDKLLTSDKPKKR